MNFVRNKITTFLILLFAGTSVLGSDKESYNDVAICEEKFIAVGTNGRIDLIERTGELTELAAYTQKKLNSVIYSEGKTVIAADSGTILFSFNLLDFKSLATGIQENINSIVQFKNNYLAAADCGKMLRSNNVLEWDVNTLPVKGNIVSLGADEHKCFGLTDQGEIISTRDGMSWTVQDYNSENKGFVKPCFFTNILVTHNQIVLVGKHDDNTPFALFSVSGNVWIERSLNYQGDDGKPHVFVGIPNDVAFDPSENQFYIACDNGDVSILSDCSKCNQFVPIGDKNLRAVAVSENYVLYVGEDFFVQIVP